MESLDFLPGVISDNEDDTGGGARADGNDETDEHEATNEDGNRICARRLRFC